ncbi:MAG: GSCFA domain-containing protein [Bacteroidaceae bacterium]|nr:GSCFA domain-containing protein [Bacteroidaceae bacterium]
MELMTRIDIPQSEWKMEAGAKVLLIGSCFADEVGQRMARGGFDARVNPFGTLYNPASIAASLLRSISEREYAAESAELIRGEMDGVWHSWMHHSNFSSADLAELVARINRTTHEVANFLRGADVLIVTLGTAIIYRLKETGMLVANCHKQPDNLFVRERLNAYDIVDQWQMLLQLLESVNPNLKVIFTVSPIRHKRDGFHVNQISKGILLQAVDEIVNGQLPNSKCGYFPSYEIMMDELRDYRFYADDMIHPSEKAVEYIWQRFQDTYFDNKTKDVVAKATKEWRKGQHRTIIDN